MVLREFPGRFGAFIISRLSLHYESLTCNAFHGSDFELTTLAILDFELTTLAILAQKQEVGLMVIMRIMLPLVAALLTSRLQAIHQRLCHPPEAE
jgi:hypothetical protein